MNSVREKLFFATAHATRHYLPSTASQIRSAIHGKLIDAVVEVAVYKEIVKELHDE